MKSEEVAPQGVFQSHRTMSRMSLNRWLVSKRDIFRSILLIKFTLINFFFLLHDIVAVQIQLYYYHYYNVFN